MFRHTLYHREIYLDDQQIIHHNFISSKRINSSQHMLIQPIHTAVDMLAEGIKREFVLKRFLIIEESMKSATDRIMASCAITDTGNLFSE